MEESKLIFYLDDDSDHSYYFKNIGGSLGHKVSVFNNGFEMLQTLFFGEGNPNVIFLNVHMPILNGEEILKTIKSSDKHKDIPVIMISGAYPKKLARYLLESGASHLMKKTDYHGLRNALEDVLK